MSMNIESVRTYCLSLPHATEDMQWECLLFRVAGKIFALVPFEADGAVISLKSTQQQAAELLEREGILRAPYLGRYHWIALETWEALSDRELRELIAESHRLVFAGLPARVRKQLEGRKIVKRAAPGQGKAATRTR